jgi:hypothetical protein
MNKNERIKLISKHISRCMLRDNHEEALLVAKEILDSIDIEKIEAQNKKLRKCVEFYANESNWGMNEFGGRDFAPDDDFDENRAVAGKMARQCLKEIGEKT